MAVQGEARRYDEQAMFVLEIDSIEVAFFETVSEFMEESGVIVGREGGSKDEASKTDGNRTITPITCVRNGVMQNTDLFDWRQEVIRVGSREAERNASIVQLNPDGSEKGRMNLQRAWPSSYKRGPFDAKADEYVKEEIVLQYHKPALVPTPA